MANLHTEAAKGELELKIFREFAKKADLPLSGAEKRNPPEPDIRCLHDQEGYIAFELVEICDPKVAKIIGDARKSKVGGVTFARTSDPSQLILRKKLEKQYETANPIELLCYTAGRVITSDDVIIPTIMPLVESHSSVFRRIWLLGEMVHLVWQDSVDCRGPELAEFG